MKDYLYDLVKHTTPLGVFEQVRVDGSDTNTTFSSTEKDRYVILRGEFHGTIDEFKGTFGIPNLPLLNTILNIDEYKDDSAKVFASRDKRQDKDQPVTIHFENGTGDFKNDFRLIASNIIDSLEPLTKFNITTWPVSFTPSVASQQRLKYQTSANPEEKTMMFRIENGTVKVNMGDASSHSGNFVFHTGVDPKVKESFMISSAYINTIFSLSGDKTVNMSGIGMMISVDSGLATYNYIMPSVNK